MTYRLISIATFSALLVSCSAQPASETAVGSIEADRIMDAIEDRIEMPEGAEPINQYTRSYFKNGDVIEAIYIDSDLAPPKGRYWSPEEIVSMEDGGCSQISVTYDAATEVITAYCNGQG